MRILLMPSSYPPVLGGVQTVAEKLAQELLDRGHEVQVVTTQYPRSLAASETKEGVKISRYVFLKPNLKDLLRGRWDLFLASLYFYPRTLFQLDQFFKNFNPEIVNVHYPDSQIPFILALHKKYGFRLVVSLHGYEIEEWFLNEKKAADFKDSELKNLLVRSNKVTACSKYLLNQANQLEPTVAAKGTSIHNGVDFERFENKISYSHPRPYLFSFGRLTHQKGFDLLIEAFRNVSDQYSNLDLIIAGEGEDHEFLSKKIREFKLEGRVILYGLANSKEIVTLLNGCEFCVVPSRREPFGITALEAVAAGKPVLATRVGGLPEFLEKFSAVLVEPTVGAITQALKEILLRIKEVKELAEKNKEMARIFSWSATSDQYLETYARG